MPELAPFDPVHLDDAVTLSRALAWPHRREDWALVANLADGVVALDGEKVVGTAFCARFGEAATLNMIIVAETHRGQGLGRQLKEAVIARAGGRRLALVATEEGMPLYRKLGFAETGRTVQYQGVAGDAPATMRRVHQGGRQDLARIAALDLAATGMDRGALLERIVAEGRLYLCDGGFACRRSFGRGQLIGPIVAPDADAARDLLHAAAAGLAGQFLRVDTLRGSGLEPALAGLVLEDVGGGIEMQTAPAMAQASAPTRSARRYALVSQALC